MKSSFAELVAVGFVGWFLGWLTNHLLYRADRYDRDEP